MAIAIPNDPAPTETPATPPTQPASERPVMESRPLDPTAEAKRLAREGLRARLNGQPPPSDGKPKPAEPAKPGTAEIDMDPATLRRMTEMSRQLREATTKLKALESVADKAKQWDNFEAIKSDPKKVLELANFDLEAYTKKLADGETPEEAETAALKAEIEATKAEVDAIKEQSRKDAEASATATMNEQRAAGETELRALFKASPDRWTFGYKAGFAAQVFDLSVAAVQALGRAVSQEEAEKIAAKAADRVEKDFKERDAAEQTERELYTGKKSGTIPASSTPANPPQSRPPTIDNSLRAVSASTIPAKKHMTIAEAKQAAKDGYKVSRARSTQ